MLPPKPRLLSVLEVMHDNPAKRSTHTDQRYPQRRSLERAAQSFVTYWLLSGLFADTPAADPGAKSDGRSIPSTTPLP